MHRRISIFSDLLRGWLLGIRPRSCSSLSCTEPGKDLIQAPRPPAMGKPVEQQVLSFNIAPFADKSPTLQELVKLGVDLSKIEKTRHAHELVLRLDFERDVQKYIRFLHDVGVPLDKLGQFFTINPFIFKEDLENLQVRINYLESKQFTPDSIARIIAVNPKWLSHSTVEIDTRLGFFQQMFSLDGNEVRLVATKMPKLITFNLQHVEANKFSVVEEMGFSPLETKEIMLQVPKVYMKTRHTLVAQFNLIHNDMLVPHELIVKQPQVLLCRERRMKERHLFLKSLGRDQYDPSKPKYVSLMSIAAHDDATFCKEIARTPVLLFNKFLKTL
ncbi:transcription termination factor 3, mitochondrial [Cimex lectularius]|uniref:Transcription termination factor 3, mitochondrial n=1 Tax=Cimex lectularius TaxID=79782 RepID=A0A8I6S6N4_CIMLE|nr:transcription termination factor 3, mitochondrial [Cimex lectularius]